MTNRLHNASLQGLKPNPYIKILSVHQSKLRVPVAECKDTLRSVY